MKVSMAKNTDVPEMDLPNIADTVDDDMGFLDFTDVEESTGFDILKPGWYPMVITGWSEKVITKLDGKLPAGTKGTQVEFTVEEGHVNQNRKAWNTYWHAKQNLGFLKGLLKASGQFTDEQLSGISYDAMREGLMGGRVMVRITVRPGTEQYPNPQNNVAQVKAYDEAAAKASGGSDLPG
jgi:hypothetical protein